MAANGEENCRQQCSNAECCWAVGSVSCGTNDECGGYTPCAVLNEFTGGGGTDSHTGTSGSVTAPANTDHGSPFPQAPDGLSVYCSPSEMEEISLHICMDKCEPASCCWNSHLDMCDESVSAELCEPYVQACAILNELVHYPDDNGANTNPVVPPPSNTNNVPRPPADFETRCARSNIIGSDNGGDFLIECEEDCLEASCCWKPGVEGCTENSRCLAYTDHCSIFVSLFQDESSSGGGASDESGSNNNDGNTDGNAGNSVTSDVPEPPNNLDFICAPENLSIAVDNGASIVACEKACLQASCCWKPGHSKDCAGAPECAAYMEPCGMHLVAGLEALESGTSIAEASGTHDSEAAQKIDQACDNQQAIFIKTKCEDACRPGNCCFDDSLACGTGVDCAVYDSCFVLFRRNLRH